MGYLTLDLAPIRPQKWRWPTNRPGLAIAKCATPGRYSRGLNFSLKTAQRRARYQLKQTFCSHHSNSRPLRTKRAKIRCTEQRCTRDLTLARDVMTRSTDKCRLIEAPPDTPILFNELGQRTLSCNILDKTVNPLCITQLLSVNKMTKKKKKSA